MIAVARCTPMPFVHALPFPTTYTNIRPCGGAAAASCDGDCSWFGRSFRMERCESCSSRSLVGGSGRKAQMNNGRTRNRWSHEYRQKPNDEIIIKYWWKLVNIHTNFFPTPAAAFPFPFPSLESGAWSLAASLSIHHPRLDEYCTHMGGWVSPVVAVSTFEICSGCAEQWPKSQSTFIYIYSAGQKLQDAIYFIPDNGCRSSKGPNE